MLDRLPIKFYFSRLNILILILFSLLLFTPETLRIGDLYLVNSFVKARVVSLGIVFLVLRGIIHDYYSPYLSMLFLVTLILAPTIPFGYLVLGTLVGVLVLKILRKF